jgi:hypothetical protein
MLKNGTNINNCKHLLNNYWCNDIFYKKISLCSMSTYDLDFINKII